MTNAFIKAQFMEPPGSGTSASPIGAVKAGTGITIAADGTISTSAGGGSVANIVANNGIQGGGTGPTVFLGLLPPTGSNLGGIKTVDGSGLSIDTDGVIRVSTTTSISGGPGIDVTDLGGDSYRIQSLPATNAVLGSVIVQGGSNGLRVAPSGLLTLAPASPTVLGGIIPGTNCTVTPGGVLNVAGGGTITAVAPGTGLGGGGTSGTATLFLKPPGSTEIGGVYAGDGVTIAPDGKLSIAAGTVVSVTGTSPIIVGGTPVTPVIGVGVATTLSSGVVTLTNSVTSTSNSTAATPNSVKQAYDLAAGALAQGALTGTSPVLVGGAADAPVISVGTATTSQLGVVQPDGTTITIDGSGVISAVTGGGGLPLTGGTMTGDIVFAGTQTFPGTLPLAGGTMTGDITFNAGQTFPNTLPLSGGTLTGAVTFAAGQTFPDTLPLAGGTLTGTVTFAAGQTFPGTLPLAGGTMTGQITFAAGQTISGYVADTLYSTTGDIAYASSGNTPARLGIGAAGTILAVNGGVPSWRTTTQLGLLTSASAATTYAPLNTPTFTGPVTVNASGLPGANALTISGGNLVLATSFTPTSSSDTGSVGEIAWDNTGYLYFCYLPNTWGRVQIDLTPF